MGKDDYHVIVYQILGYLYQQLKAEDWIDDRDAFCRDAF